MPELLRQQPGQPRNLLAREPRNEPVRFRGVHLVQRDQRDGECHAVAGRTRLVVVLEREAPPGHFQVMRKLCRSDAGRLVPHQVFPPEEQQLRIFAFRFAAPTVEIGAVVGS